MPTLQTGSVEWGDGKIIYLNADHATRAGIPPVEAGRLPYTSVMLLDESGTVLTFSSSSWGGRNACEALIPQYRMQGQTMLPVVSLGSRPRNNAYGTIDPQFVVKDWTPRSKFSEILRPEEIEPKALAAPDSSGAKSETVKPKKKKKILVNEMTFNDEIDF
jgi:hypothetical protein